MPEDLALQDQGITVRGVGDHHQKGALEIEFNHEKYIVVPHSALVLLIREDDLLD